MGYHRTPIIHLVVFLSTISLASTQSGPPFINNVVQQVEARSPRPEPIPELTPSDLLSSYDFIIVGSGPAGCVLANRLSENPSITVLLLEAGPRQSTLNTIPAFAPYARTPETQWNFSLEKYRDTCLGYKGERCTYGLGKALGGSSAINYMVYVRGNRYDFDRWELMGNDGWGFDSILPMFQRVENVTGFRHETDGRYRGYRGNLDVTQNTYRSRVSDLMIQTIEDRGLEFRDYNGEFQTSVDYIQMTTRGGRRMSAVEAYLNPVAHRKNLHIMVNSLVSKVMLQSRTMQAQGVQFLYQGATHRVRVKKEVILSAGPIKSPQILWLSGIGPRQDLRQYNIPVLVNLPVGMKYLDHVSYGAISARTQWPNETINLKEISQADVDDFVERNSGKLTVAGNIEVVSFQRTLGERVPGDYVDTELVFSTGKNNAGVEGFTGMKDEVFNATMREINDSPDGLMSFQMIHLHPKSQGRLRIGGPSIHDNPQMEYPLLKDPDDMDVLVRGAREAVARLSSQRMQEGVGARINSQAAPACASHRFNSDNFWRCQMRQLAVAANHAAATNKMGPVTDSEAVVDAQLRVYGTRRLRVGDTSISPTTVSCHTQALSYVVGEKLADMLKKEWRL